MKKLFVIPVVVLLVGVFTLVNLTYPAFAAPKYTWPKSFSVISPAKGPKYFSSLAFSGVLEEKTGMKVRLTPNDVHAQSTRLLKAGDYQIMVQSTSTYGFIAEAETEYAERILGPVPVKAMWVGAVEPFSPMVRGDSKLKTMHDLKPGVTFAVPPGAAPRSSPRGLAAWAGLKKGEYELVEFGSMGACVKAVVDGKADITWWIPNAPNTFEAETNPRGLRWLELDPVKNPEGAKRALVKKPAWQFGVAPPSVVKSAKGIGLVLIPTIHYVMEDLDTGLVYNLCKFMGENAEAIKKKHPSAAMSIKDMRTVIETSFLPLHEGTIKYLKEKGIWTAADEKRQAYNEMVQNKYRSAWNDAIADADKKGVKVGSRNKEWVNLWREYKKDIPRIKVMFEIP